MTSSVVLLPGPLQAVSASEATAASAASRHDNLLCRDRCVFALKDVVIFRAFRGFAQENLYRVSAQRTPRFGLVFWDFCGARGRQLSWLSSGL